jgi:hypothetical protein
MIFENYVRENKSAFLAKVQQIAQALKFNPDWLMAVMMHESGLNHRAMNSIGCVGLIQFCPGGGLSMFGLSSAQMANMTNVQQLDYVYRFFLPIAGKANSFQDVHLYAFAPSSFPYKNNRSHTIGSEVGQASLFASQNRAFDVDLDGRITVGNFQDYDSNWLKSRGVALSSGGNNFVRNLVLAGLLAYWIASD